MKKKHRGRGATPGRKWIFFLLALVVFVIDRLTKWLALRYITEEMVVIPSLLSFNFVVNTGAGFGILGGKTLLLIVVSALVILMIFLNTKSILKEKYFWAVALILGGALANLFDRVFFGFVIDFIALPYWPVFNIADACITIGAVGLGVYLIKEVIIQRIRAP